MTNYSVESDIAERQRAFESTIRNLHEQTDTSISEETVQKYLDAYGLVLKLLFETKGALSYVEIFCTVFPQIQDTETAHSEFNQLDLNILLRYLILSGEIVSEEPETSFLKGQYRLKAETASAQ